ncbi:PREDICTED: rRNA methyltransferase 1, mitochondrial-like isoform X2 [Amphimedon queenslandica]|uniref:tRNA/rRNA methyltransferase SpoU type domain-containing protein n=1 Tax=Amphimedon queenslandica TaxID=400682 RepID=A0AAN0JJV4_AMPQE|nr:PREDICTED: rRNA methyltransferase 1, mitochondrial-like isoform X2 [Amphimedon queenslandica]|eukprot:XP_019856963.1 PREDICTED: rRNA methyltransferase 1, mitochondrial-like isoform X2 [Amphimedon queenslandica]
MVDTKLLQGILMDVEPLRFKPMTLESNLLNHKQFSKAHLLWLLLYHVQDPMNFGAIIRSAYFFGVDRILVTNKSCPLSPVVSKSSAGAMEMLSIHSISDVISLLKVAADKGWDILGTVSPNKFEHFSVISASDHKVIRPTMLIVGNEGHGLTKEVCSCCTKLLTINPKRSLSPGFDSLNVSVATGILLNTLYNNKI